MRQEYPVGTFDPLQTSARYWIGQMLGFSSATSEPGLEVEVPKAVTDVLAPVNRQPVAALEPIPPSAQIIPYTITEKTTVVQAPHAKRRRLMKDPAAVYRSPEPAKQKHALRLTLPNAHAAVLPRSSSPVDSSSPPALPTLPHQPAETPSVMLSAEAQLTPAPADRSEVVAATSQLEANQGSSNSTDKPPPNGPSSQVPYTAFTVAYPDYRGGLKTFIRGVMCILPLQKDRALPEFLYDDFVRVFSTDFLKYIGSLNEGARPLSAIQFYNENVSRPLYTKGVLSKDNINDVPNKYPKESCAIQQTLEKSETKAHRRLTRQAPDRMAAGEQMVQLPAVPTDTSHTLQQNNPPSVSSVTNPESATREVSPPPAPIHPAMQMRPLQEHRGVNAPPAASPDVSGIPSVRQRRTPVEISASTAGTSATGLEVLRTQVDSSPPNIRPSPTPTVTKINLPVPSTFPSNVLSQISNPDSIPETALKRRATPRASAGSSAAERGGEFKRQKTATKDADKRALRFRKFLMQKKMQSSAPEQSTPP
ncbi:hypothetical protein B0I37DRAFT_409747 [Chaetomium sp. MPI-CAGE-AT-0009]|nr:hypothetical protein B0I37DRAFT_409747 [Chaetomium sp. MPI-CAGE-AT-0009]